MAKRQRESQKRDKAARKREKKIRRQTEVPNNNPLPKTLDTNNYI